MDREFDGYYKWLGIPPTEQPPNHYRLLGLADFEPDVDVIEGAADRQMAHVRTFQAGPHSALSQRILSEISAAKICLLDRDRKTEYDRSLRIAKQSAAQSKPAAQHATTPTPPPRLEAIAPPLLIKTEPRAGRRANKRAPALIAIAGCFAAALALTLYAAVAMRGDASSNGHRESKKHAVVVAKRGSQSPPLRGRSGYDGERNAEATGTAETGARDTADAPARDPAAAVISPETTEATEKPHVAPAEGGSEAKRPAKPPETSASVAENSPAMPAEENEASPDATAMVSAIPHSDGTSDRGASPAERADDHTHALDLQELDDKAAAVKARAASARAPDALESLAMEYWSLMSRAVELDDFERASRFATSMIHAARKTRDKGLQTDLQARAKQMQALRAAFNEAKAALTAWRADAADANASGTSGRYLAWFKGNWSDGLPLLAKGGDEVAVIAARELTVESSAETIVALADEWSRIAEHEKGVARRSLEDHACQWYERASMLELPQNEQQAVRKKIERSFGAATVYELPDNRSGIQLGGAEVNIGEVATVEFWVCTQGRDTPLLTKRQTSDDQSLTFYLSGGHADVIGDGPFYRVDVWDAETAEINDGRWHHVAAVKRGKVLSLFVDGQLAGRGATIDSFHSESPWILGVHRPWNSSLEDGRFCRLRISNIARYHPSFTPDRGYTRDQYTVWMP